MSGKLLKKLEEDPPNASSSGEEDEEEEEDAVANSSSSEEETDSESETETEPVANPPVKADSEKVETFSKPETKKRPSETDDGEAKRVKRVSGEDDNKKSSGGGEETNKKNCFQRVWSEEDEIAVLQGIIDFKNETGSSPYDDKNALYDLVKKSVSFDVSKTQFMEKIRALKKKFENNLGRGKKKGKDPSFSKAHDRKAFDLAKLVWGDNGVMALESSAAGKSKKVEPAVKKKEEEEPAVVKRQEFGSIVELVARFGVDDLAAKQGWSRLSSEDKKRFEEQWKELQLKEFKFYSQKSGFIHEVVTKMAEASRPNH